MIGKECIERVGFLLAPTTRERGQIALPLAIQWEQSPLEQPDDRGIDAGARPASLSLDPSGKLWRYVLQCDVIPLQSLSLAGYREPYGTTGMAANRSDNRESRP